MLTKEEIILGYNEIDLRMFLTYNLDHHSFDGVSDETRIKCIDIHPVCVGYMSNPEATMEMKGRAFSLSPLFNFWIEKDEIKDIISSAFDCVLYNQILDLNIHSFFISAQKPVYKTFPDAAGYLHDEYRKYKNLEKEQFFNKHGDKSVDKLWDLMQTYKTALNKIDDYFVYEISEQRNKGIELNVHMTEEELNNNYMRIAKEALDEGKSNY